MEILIADDSKMVRFMTLEALHALGYSSITEAANVSEAKNLLFGKKYDLIISDFHMPGETGLDFLRYVRATPEYSKIPFVLLTTDGEKKNIVAAVQAGVQAYLFKPVQKIALAQKLTEISKKFNFQPPNISSFLSSTNAQPTFESYSAQSITSYVTPLVSNSNGYSFKVTNNGLQTVDVVIGKGMAEAFPTTVIGKFAGVRYIFMYTQATEVKYKETIEKWNQELGCFCLVIPDAETNHTAAYASTIIDQLCAEGVDSSAVIIAFGEQSLLDFAGYIAASYLGGISLILVPQSLSAYLNASVSSIRFVHGLQRANISGYPYDASLVWFDIADFLAQSDSAYAFDCLELLRYSFIGGTELVDLALKTWEKVQLKDEAAIIEMARMCIGVRRSIHAQNLCAQSKNALLSFAQPIADALLRFPFKTPLLPGQALCKAILCLFDASNKAGAFARNNAANFVELIKKMPLYKIPEPIDVSALLDSTSLNDPLRKSTRIVALPKEAGVVILHKSLTDEALKESLTAVLNPPAA